MKPLELVEQLYAAYNSRDPVEVGRLYHPDGEHEDIAHGRPKRGTDAIVAGLKTFFGWFPDAHWERRSVIGGADDHVAITYILTATLQSPMGSIVPCGQRIQLRGAHVLLVRGGLIQRSQDYWDASTFQRQLNVNQREVKP
jgi:steroid delta-isomerase-like uncharacterized protein